MSVIKAANCDGQKRREGLSSQARCGGGVTIITIITINTRTWTQYRARK